MEDGSEVTEHQFTSDGQHDNSEEFTNDIKGCLTQIFGEPMGTDEHQIQDRDTKYQGDAKACYTILSRNGQKGGKRPGSGIHREGQRNDRTIRTNLPLELIILEDRDIQNHLQGHEENNKSSGNCEMLNLHAENLQDPLSEEEEGHQNQEAGDTNLMRIDLKSLFLYRDGNRNVTKWVNNRD